ncbi:acyl-CoA dehydrogenase family protein [Nocardioides massiliensis]|uniref:Alkylation response protein AidB-like acyl-CoA dehydrogenase n=1 Tax=Nocardioides massiliensis TaxID=1325935 RepID=A0ABT9NRX8_9ACTN|nr:acyl-CoA dehydrogenase family protein [Nocardioides massiliensis]MDP9823174.1 alkylation response protein AidB-like acyl-CoA dehydrogenase [Nocardioides massiliensis]
MEFALTEEQEELVSTVRSLLTKRADSAAVRAASTSESGHDPALWQLLVEQIGAAALAVPEAHGGAGFTLFETLLILEEVGRSLAPSPLLASVLTSEALLATSNPDSALLEPLAAGTLGTVALAGDTVTARQDGDGWVLEGTATNVLEADQAEVLLVVAGTDAGPTLFVVDPAEAQPTWVPSMDQALRIGDIAYSATPARPLAADATAVAARINQVGAAATAALQVGVASRALEMTVAYAKEREQFGRPIGSFQALKHRMADMLVQVEMSRSASWAASYAVAHHTSEADRLAHVAKSYCGEALEHVAAETVQLHGGIAITWEHDAHLVFKRAHALGQLFGTPLAHRAALAR